MHGAQFSSALAIGVNYISHPDTTQLNPKLQVRNVCILCEATYGYTHNPTTIIKRFLDIQPLRSTNCINYDLNTNMQKQIHQRETVQQFPQPLKS